MSIGYWRIIADTAVALGQWGVIFWALKQCGVPAFNAWREEL